VLQKGGRKRSKMCEKSRLCIQDLLLLVPQPAEEPAEGSARDRCNEAMNVTVLQGTEDHGIDMS